MFNNMKNRIREKTGTEIPKFTASSGSLFGKKSNQHSRQSSQGSINSNMSDISNKEESEARLLNSPVQKGTHSDDLKITEEKQLKISNAELADKLVAKEKEWREKEKEYVADLIKQTKELQEALSLVEENKKKYQCCQEEKEQLEIYQKQEVTKIKQLLLTKEEENNSNLVALKNALTSVESLKHEIERLRPLEEKVNACQDDLECLRHTSERERWNLTSQLAQKDEVVRHLEERIAVLTHRTEADCQALGAQLSVDERVRSLMAERALLERRLEEAHIHLSEIKTSWSNKIAALETQVPEERGRRYVFAIRSASKLHRYHVLYLQVGRLSRQAGEESVERRNAEKKISHLENRLEELTDEKSLLVKKIDKLAKERDDLASELKELSVNVQCQREDRDERGELTNKLELLSKENEALKLSNEESRRIYDESLSKEINKNNALSTEMCRLKEYSLELAAALEKEREVKDQTLFRNAEISQLVQLTEQELKQQQIQNEELFKKITHLEEQLETAKQDLKQLQTERGDANEKKLDERVRELENEIFDKNKTIRILQQNLNDVKKTFQDELKNTASNNLSVSHTNGTAVYNNDGGADKGNGNGNADEDINFKYMKHVLIKFLTSSEYEAQQLTKAVAMLLKLDSEEERLIKDTLEWRTSWFGSKPRVKLHYNPS